MNKTGKGNGIFVILIPIILIITLVVVDTVVSYTTNLTFKKVTESIISDVMNNQDIYIDEYSEEIKRAYERKGYETDMLVVEANDYYIYVENEHSFFGIFSSLTNKRRTVTEMKILGVTVKVKKNSVARVKVNASYNDDKIEFEYTE